MDRVQKLCGPGSSLSTCCCCQRHKEPPGRRLQPIDHLGVVVAHPVDTARAVPEHDEPTSGFVDRRIDDGGDGRVHVDRLAVRVVRESGVGVLSALSSPVLFSSSLYISSHPSPKKARALHRAEHFVRRGLDKDSRP